MGLAVAIAMFTTVTVVPLAALAQTSDDAAEQFASFADAWDDSRWEQDFRSWDGYMRTSADEGWKTRMRALQSLVKTGAKAVPVLEKQLVSEHAPTRILAAQTLGYLAPQANMKTLLRAAQEDPDPAVRLYAVDAIGMSGKGDSVDWEALLSQEKDRDVKKHLRYAQERQDTPLSPSIVDRLVAWDWRQAQTAQLGQKAPDFQLQTVTGEEIRLSQFQGKQHVVLIFVYGDT